MGVAAGVGGQACRDKSEIGAVTRFRDMFHKFGKKFGKFRVPTRRRWRRDGSLYTEGSYAHASRQQRSITVEMRSKAASTGG